MPRPDWSINSPFWLGSCLMAPLGFKKGPYNSWVHNSNPKRQVGPLRNGWFSFKEDYGDGFSVRITNPMDFHTQLRLLTWLSKEALGLTEKKLWDLHNQDLMRWVAELLPCDIPEPTSPPHYRTAYVRISDVTKPDGTVETRSAYLTRGYEAVDKPVYGASIKLGPYSVMKRKATHEELVELLKKVEQLGPCPALAPTPWIAFRNQPPNKGEGIRFIMSNQSFSDCMRGHYDGKTFWAVQHNDQPMKAFPPSAVYFWRYDHSIVEL